MASASCACGSPPPGTKQPPFPRPPVRPIGSFRSLPQKANSLQPSRAKIVQFLSDHHYEAESTLRRLVHKETESDTNDESSATLDKAANDISKWISDLLAEIRP